MLQHKGGKKIIVVVAVVVNTLPQNFMGKDVVTSMDKPILVICLCFLFVHHFVHECEDILIYDECHANQNMVSRQLIL